MQQNIMQNITHTFFDNIIEKIQKINFMDYHFYIPFILFLYTLYTFIRERDVKVTNETVNEIKIVDLTNKFNNFTRKIHKTKKFDDIFKQYKKYNKIKKEGKNFTYTYSVRNAFVITIDDRDYFEISGKYHGKNLKFTFGTNEYYEDNNYNGQVLFNKNIMNVADFVEQQNFKYIDDEIMCDILNVYYDKFHGFNDKAFWHKI